MGDRVQLQQVFLNLVMNAIEAMAPVRDRARVLVVTTGSGEADQTQIRVKDSGTGIAPKDGDNIFRPFFTTKSQGIGMGLRNLPLDHRGAWRAAVGVARRSARGGVSH